MRVRFSTETHWRTFAVGLALDYAGREAFAVIGPWTFVLSW